MSTLDCIKTPDKSVIPLNRYISFLSFYRFTRVSTICVATCKKINKNKRKTKGSKRGKEKEKKRKRKRKEKEKRRKRKGAGKEKENRRKTKKTKDTFY